MGLALTTALGAHLRGDDAIAMHAGKIWCPLQRRCLGWQQSVTSKRFAKSPETALSRILPLRDPPARLLEESARRVKAAAVRRALEVGLDKFPDQSQRIAADP